MVDVHLSSNFGVPTPEPRVRGPRHEHSQGLRYLLSIVWTFSQMFVPGQLSSDDKLGVETVIPVLTSVSATRTPIFRTMEQEITGFCFHQYFP